MATALTDLKRFDEAIMALEAALHIALRKDLRRDQVLIDLEWGRIELKQQNYGLAEQHGVAAQHIAEDQPDLLEDAEELLRNCGHKPPDV